MINKRAGGMGLISGRKAFRKPMEEVFACSTRSRIMYLSDQVGIA